MTSPVWHPFTQHGLKEAIPQVVSARGSVLTLADGSTLIDGISSWWVITHGHCHPPIVEAIQKQAGQLDQLIFAGYTHEPAEDVARGLIALTDAHLPSPDPLARVFFTDSGSTAVEVALKMALGYWHNRGEARHRIIVLEHGYHGDTIGTMSVGERGVFNRAYAPLLFDVASVPFPYLGQEQTTLDALEAACRKGDVAAFICEPLVVGAGGMLMYPAATLREMAAICARHDVLFIADEVMTGWGRTGTVLACEQAGVTPDILCLAKGLTGGAIPMAVTMAREKIFAAHYGPDRETMFFHSSSFTANPIACAAARANLALWRAPDVQERVTALGNAITQRLAVLGACRGLDNIRQMGTIAAVDLVTGEQGYMAQVAPVLSRHFREAGILMRPLGNTIYIMPPYCTDSAQLDVIFSAIADASERFGTAL